MRHTKNYANESVRVCEHNPVIFLLAPFPKKSQGSAPLWTHIV